MGFSLQEPCPDNAAAVEGACVCNAGFAGNINQDAVAEAYAGDCDEVDCPLNATGGAGDCSCTEGFGGTITWNEPAQAYEGYCQGSRCL